MITTNSELDVERQQKARKYATTKRLISIADLILGTAYLLAIVLTGLAVSVRNAVDSVPGGRVGIVAAYFLILWLGYTVISAPLTVGGGWLLPRRYGISVQSLGQWLGDWLKETVLGLVLGLVVIEAVFALLQALPTLWWLATAAFYLVLIVGMANLAPILILPLFYKLTSLEPSDLTRNLEALATRAGARVGGVYRMNLSAKTTAANAALMGLGNTRRIVIGDTLLDRYSPAEIEVVFAHELGHHVHHDVPRLVIGQVVGTMVGLFLAGLALRWGVGAFGYQSISDVAVMPLLALVLGAFGVISAPVFNYLSRRFENEADLYALRTTDDAPSFISAMTRLANQNLAEYDPARWVEVLFYDHPALGRRVAVAQKFAAGQVR